MIYSEIATTIIDYKALSRERALAAPNAGKSAKERMADD
jgi:hypothetical protein